LDDEANHVEVVNNTIELNASGMQLHNAYDNLIQGNLFYKNKNQQILINETVLHAVVNNNHISSNHFVNEKDVPVYRLWSALGSLNIVNFAWYSGNYYQGDELAFAECAGSGMLNWKAWKNRMRESGSLIPIKP
jgi:parallel beta-helix repeat protein